MEAIIGLIELAVCMILFFLASLMFARISGYGEFYDKILYNDYDDIDMKIYNNKENDDDNIRSVSFRN
jgi:hypothetical protein